jgi:hypothetical protein
MLWMKLLESTHELHKCKWVSLILLSYVDMSDVYRPSYRRLSAKLLPTFADSGCCVVSSTELRVISAFYIEAATISSKQLFNCTHAAECTPFQTHYSENLVAPGIELGISGSVARNSDH